MNTTKETMGGSAISSSQINRREMIVVYAPGTNAQTPMIRLANRFLLTSGFTIGSRFEVEYTDGVITISRIR